LVQKSTCIGHMLRKKLTKKTGAMPVDKKSKKKKKAKKIMFCSVTHHEKAGTIVGTSTGDL